VGQRYPVFFSNDRGWESGMEPVDRFLPNLTVPIFADSKKLRKLFCRHPIFPIITALAVREELVKANPWCPKRFSSLSRKRKAARWMRARLRCVGASLSRRNHRAHEKKLLVLWREEQPENFGRAF